MRDLRDMNIGERAIATVIIVVTIMLVLAFIGYVSGRWEVEAAPVVISPYETHLIELDKQALDRAYATQMGQVFSIWIKDGVADPSRARVGFANARKGYNAAMIDIEQRQRLQ